MTNFSPARLSDFQRDVFPREQSRSLRNKEWASRLKRKATWLEILSWVGFVMFMAVCVWVH